MEEPNKTPQESKIESEPKSLNQLNFRKSTLGYELAYLKSKYEEVTVKRISLRRDQSRIRLKCARLTHTSLDTKIRRNRHIEASNKEKAEKKRQEKDKRMEKAKAKIEEEVVEEEEEEDMMILTDNTSDKNKGTMPMDVTYSSADKVFRKKPPKVPVKPASGSSRPPLKLGSGSQFGESHKSGEFGHVGSGSETGRGLTDIKMPPSPGGGETTSCAKRPLEFNNDKLQKLLGIDEVGYYLSKTGLGPIQEDARCTSIIGIDDPFIPGVDDLIDDPEKSPQKKAKSESRSTKYEPRWKSPDDMIFSLNNFPGMRLDAICALYRHVRRMREEMAFRLSESQFEKIACIVEALTDGNALGPCIRTPEELEDIYNGSNAFCSWLIYTYSCQIYHIYVTNMDKYFC